MDPEIIFPATADGVGTGNNGAGYSRARVVGVSDNNGTVNSRSSVPQGSDSEVEGVYQSRDSSLNTPYDQMYELETQVGRWALIVGRVLSLAMFAGIATYLITKS